MFQRTKICTGLLIAIAGGSFGASAFAQDTTVQRVEVIGSSIKRVDSETDAPIQTISHEEIAKSGATSVEELMRHITANQSAGSTAAASSSGATTGGISTISLRGLGPQRTLVLVNGQRSAPYGSPTDSVAVDIDSIPIAAIERVEVLKEGAGAIYGSDAVAGVVNFVLRKDYTGVEATAYYGTSYDGKGTVTKGSILTGFNGEKGNVTFVLTAEHDLPLYGRDRAFANSVNFPDKDNTQASSGTYPANIYLPGMSTRFNPAVPVALNSAGTGFTRTNASQADCGTQGSVVSGTSCLFDFGPFVSLQPDTKRVGALLSGHYDVSDTLSVHGDVSITNKTQYVLIQPAPIGSYVSIPYTLTTASPYYPTAFVTGITSAATAAGLYSGSATPDLTLRYRPFITGGRGLTDSGTNARATLGADGSVAGWDYAANLVYSTSAVTETLNSGYFRIDTDSTGLGIEDLLDGKVKDSSGNTLWTNPFGASTAASSAAALATNFVGTAYQTHTTLSEASLKFSKDDLAKLPGGNVGAAFGVDLRKDEYKLTSSPALASGNISGYGGNFESFSRSRNVASVFGELDVPIIKGWDVDAAARYDKYGSTSNPNSTAGGVATLETLTSTNNDTIPVGLANQIATAGTQSAGGFSQGTWKLGSKFVLNKEFLARGTISTGFRAPSLLDLYAPVQTGVTAAVDDPKRCNDPADDQTDCATQFNEFTGGRGNLKPERSTTWTLGGVFEPIKDTSVSVDYFHTNLRDAITALTPEFLLAHEAQYPNAIVRGPSDGIGNAGPIIGVDQRLTNLTAQRLAGLDFDLTTRLNSSVGRFTLAVGGTWFLKDEAVNPDGSIENQINTTSSTSVGVTPRVKLANEVSWRAPSGVLELTGIYNWQSGGNDQCGNLIEDNSACPAGVSAPKYRSYGTADFQAKWDPIKSFTGTIGVKDAFQAKVPYVNGNGGAFQGGYDPTYVDPHGRFWYASATVRF